MSVADYFPVGSRCWYLQWNPVHRWYRWQRVEIVAHTVQRVGVRFVRGGVTDPAGPHQTRYVLPFSLTDSDPTTAAREIRQ